MSKILNKTKTMTDLLSSTEANTLQLEYNDLQARYTALFKLNELSQICEDLDTFYQQIHMTIDSLIHAENFYIIMYDQTFSTLEFVYHVDEKSESPTGSFAYEKYNGSLTHRVIESAQGLLATHDVIKEIEKEGTFKYFGVMGTGWLGVPLINDGLVIGVMALKSYKASSHYEENDLNLLTFAAQHIVSAMLRLQDHELLQDAVNARTRELMEQIREREKAELLQESLYKISKLTNNSNLELNAFYHQVHNIVGQMIDSTNFFIAKCDSENEELAFAYYVDETEDSTPKAFTQKKLLNRCAELVINSSKIQLLSPSQIQDLYPNEMNHVPENIHSWLGVPLIHAEAVIGLMVVQSYRPNSIYTNQDAELLNFVAQQVSIAIKHREAADYERQAHELLEQQVKLRTVALEEEISQRKKAEKQLKHTASHDSLTGLPNRVVFIDLLNHAIANKKRNADFKFAVLFLDLDRFKIVNDSLGHYAGDLLLKIIAKELTSLVREIDTVARLGGDEFVILIEDIESNDKAFEIAERITHLLEQPFTIEEQLVFIGTSIGILFSDLRYDNASTMLRDADTAMYYAKDNGKGRYEVFDASMHNKVKNALSLEADIREAIDLQEFIPYFQPIIQLSNNQLMGFEALARWDSSKRGFVFPDEFIPLAEDTNLVMGIDLQIIEKSCLQLKAWHEKLQCNDLYISCNLYCKQFFNVALPQEISQILTRVGLSPQHLRIEITERALMENTDVVLTNIRTLKELGIKILLDDFGTGYSSLSYLHKFPLDVLKIDRSFVNNMHEHANNRAIIKTIVDLAANLNMVTVGEGIEQVEDAELLNTLECQYGQGYYFAKPMTALNAEAYIIQTLA